MYDILVIGGGPAGVTAALRASELGAQVALVESGRLGGTCTNDGCVPTRVFAKAARLMRDAEQFDDYGLVGEPPQLDFSRLLARTQQVVYQIHEKKQIIDHLTQAGVKVYDEVGPARFENANTISLRDGTRLNAKKFILSAGGHARRLEFPGSQYALTHSDVWSLRKLPRSIIIAGSAATGCQLGTIFNSFGCQVTMLERAPRILAGEDEAISAVIQSSFEKRGVTTITGIGGIESIEKVGDDMRVHITRQDQVIDLDAEAVMLSAGWLGNLDPLNLPAAGVETKGPYVWVDDYLRTSTENIFAAGDITGKMMLVQSASYEARVAAENAVIGVGRRNEHQIVPHGGFTDPEYGSVGLTEAKARESYDIAVAVVPFADLDRAVIDSHPVGLCKLIVSRETHRILGAHVVGEDAQEVVEIVAAGMAADMWVEQLAELEIAYPTFTAVVGLAAREIVHQLGVQPMARTWRALGKAQIAEWEHRSSDMDEGFVSQ
jgi:pyruvate/2-oxoglutarate dehydrogenase complex dihydrolipoamide dehydrogenase (E3) component